MNQSEHNQVHNRAADTPEQQINRYRTQRDTATSNWQDALHEIDRLTAENKALRSALVAVREWAHCTKLAPHAYDADHHCGVCGTSSAHAKDVIDEALASTGDEK